MLAVHCEKLKITIPNRLGLSRLWLIDCRLARTLRSHPSTKRNAQHYFYFWLCMCWFLVYAYSSTPLHEQHFHAVCSCDRTQITKGSKRIKVWSGEYPSPVQVLSSYEKSWWTEENTQMHNWLLFSIWSLLFIPMTHPLWGRCSAHVHCTVSSLSSRNIRAVNSKIHSNIYLLCMWNGPWCTE